MKNLITIASVVVLFMSLTAKAQTQSGIYTVFKNHDEAEAWLRNYERTVLSRELNASPRPVVPHSDPRYSHFEPMISHVWQGIQKVFPLETSGLPCPQFLILAEPLGNAYAIYDSAKQTYPLLFVMNSGFESPGLTDEQAKGTFAHELTHLVLKHAVPGINEGLQKFYMAGPGNEPLGLTQSDNPTLRSAIKKWISLAKDVGPFPRAELHDLPLSVLGTAQYDSLLKFIFNKYSSTGASLCSGVRDAGGPFAASLSAGLSNFDQALSLTSTQAAQLDRAASNYKAALQTCLSGRRGDLVSLLAEQYGLDPGLVKASVDPSDVSTFDSAVDTFDGILKVTKNDYEKMNQIAAKYPIEYIRYYSREEQADESSVRVMLALNETQPDAQADWFLNIFLSSSERDRCNVFRGAERRRRTVVLSTTTTPPATVFTTFENF